MNSSRKRRIGFILFPELTQLDLTGPWEVFTRIPDTECCLLADTIAPVRSASELCIVPGATYSDCGQMDIIVVPGGPGHFDAMLDDKLLSFLRAQEKGCERMIAVCTERWFWRRLDCSWATIAPPIGPPATAFSSLELHTWINGSCLIESA